jgi:hypothetical protein
MGLLDFFKKQEQPGLTRLPSGSFTVDATGRVLTSTIPQSFPGSYVQEIAGQVLGAFRKAQAAQLPLSEIVIYYASMKVTARELRGGAIIFLAPQTLKQS